MTTQDLKNQKLTLKDVFYIVVWAVSVAIGIARYESKVNAIERQVNEMQQTLKTNNLEVINYKLDRLADSFDKFIERYEKDRAAGHN